MKACITILGNDIFGSMEGRTNYEVRIAVSDETIAALKMWAQRYDRALLSKEPSTLFAIGKEMFTWLDVNGWASKWARGSNDRTLEVALEDDTSEIASLLLDLPWEILVFQKDFLTADSIQPYIVHRRIGSCGGESPPAPQYRDLSAMFMAAAPEGQHELDFEAEEAAILAATERLPMQLLVEESGCIDFLEERLSLEGPFETVHLSCHGDIHPKKGPILALETSEGKLAAVTPGELANALGQEKAHLVFLSACRTAECNYNGNADGEFKAVESYVRSLVRAGVSNVLGWDGSVYDSDAILFARIFYRKLAEFSTVPYAAAMARRDLLQTHRNDPDQGRHWHLARVYTGRQGGGPLCRRGKTKRRLGKDTGFKEFLDKANHRVPVATAQQFVGRRRQAQKVIGLLREDQWAGVLIYGMGNLGKSSLAARIANRMSKHKTSVIYDRYDSLAICDQLLAALPAAQRDVWQNQWREKIKANGTLLANLLEELLTGPLDEQPMLLIIDDLEQILEAPLPDQQRTPVKETFRTALAAVLQAFKAAETESRLLLTSRYRFTLPDGRGKELADLLASVQLPSMAERERVKLWQAAKRTAADGQERAVDEQQESAQEALAKQVVAVAGGNPGLQEILCRPLLAGELKAAADALAAVAAWKASGEIPQEESAAQEFFQRISFDVYQKALTEPQKTLLRAGTLFTENLPVPHTAFFTMGEAVGMRDPQTALARLINLGLMDSWGDVNGVGHLAANPLAVTLVQEKLSKTEQAFLAAAAISPIADAWLGAEGDVPRDLRGVEAARLALIGKAPAIVMEKAALVAGSFLYHQEHNAKEALKILTSALGQIDAANHQPSTYFLRLAANCAERIGERRQQLDLLERGLKIQSDNTIAMALIAVDHATAIKADDPEKALKTLKDAAALFKEVGHEESYAGTMGRIADILTACGDLDEALRIRTEEELPVYERLGDVRSKAVATGKIAIILSAHGKADEALQILQKEVLPIFERLGDVRSKAVTMGKIADILMVCGEIDEALRIRTEEELPVYEGLGDVREKAIAMGRIADILADRGELDEALHIFSQEELPVYERLGDVQSKAIAIGKIANILTARGDFDEALRIHIEERLPVAEAMKNLNDIAIVRFSCAHIRIERGGLKRGEIQTIYEELAESFDINTKLQQIDGIAYSGKMLGKILMIAGLSEEARIPLERSAAAFETLQRSWEAKEVRSLLKSLKR